MFSQVLDRLDGVGKITVAAYENRGIIEVVPCHSEKIGGDHDIDALLHRHVTSKL